MQNPAGIESRPEKAGNQQEATIASSSEMAARSVWGDPKTKLQEPTAQGSQLRQAPIVVEGKIQPVPALPNSDNPRQICLSEKRRPNNFLLSTTRLHRPKINFVNLLKALQRFLIKFSRT
jgi:hypothetical protein